jgi:uncharacterized protein
MSQLKARIQKSTTDAMKAKDAARVQTLRLAFNAVRKKEIDTRVDLTDAEVEKTLLTMIKQINETIEHARKANNQATIDESEAELKVLKEFLPQPMSEADVEAEVRKIVDGLKAAGTMPSGNAGMGLVMKTANAQIGSRSEGRLIQIAVKKVLGI